MIELMRTNDVVALSYADALLTEAGIYHVLADSHTSIMEGSLGFLPRRLLVMDEDLARARECLAAGGLEKELSPHG